ncbi:MAG TPA: HAMP domain-containing sensor histidine kinase [Planctomycetota bacterium]|nr:HAMP domain-containing sensor histidine kinase [Planctomycetota bacterium]
MSLRAKVLVGFAATNLVVFGVLAVLVARASALEDEHQRAYRREVEASVGALARTLAGFLRVLSGPEGGAIAEIQRWPGWGAMRDAVILNRYVRLGETLVPTAVYVNPLGARHRSPDFDAAAASARIADAIDRKATIADGEAIAEPVVSIDGEGERIWGGAYLLPRLPPPPAAGVTLRSLAIGLVASLALGTALTFLGLSRWVLRPVESLAATSRRIARGEDARVPAAPPRRDEIADLVRSFGSMVVTIRGHRAELEREVREASARAGKAERDLLLAQRLAAAGTLAAGIAHEINNPLGGMLNAARALRAGRPERREEYLDLLLEGLDRIRGIVGRLLEMTPHGGEPERVDLARPLETALAFVAHRFQKSGIEVLRRVEEGAAVRGDARALGQVFLNLLLNAADALESGSARARRIEVTIRREGGTVLASVCDGGPGMDPAALPRAFDLFFTTKPKGTGLGLPMVHAVVRDHGGTIELANRPGGGFEVAMRFPAFPGPPPAASSRGTVVG